MFLIDNQIGVTNLSFSPCLIPSMNSLKYIKIGGNKIGTTGITHLLFLLQSLQNISLAYLDISNNNILHSENVLNYLTKINCSELKDVNLNDNRIGNKYFPIIIEAIENVCWPELEILRLRCNHLRTSTLFPLIKVLQTLKYQNRTKLKFVLCEGNYISPSFFTSLVSLDIIGEGNVRRYDWE